MPLPAFSPAGKSASRLLEPQKNKDMANIRGPFRYIWNSKEFRAID
jgi:hypothetical protein